MDFEVIRQATDKSPEFWDMDILALDPGHTTGWAHFAEGLLEHQGEMDTRTIDACVLNATQLFNLYNPFIVVIEDYRVYKWRKDHHVGSEMITTQVIGALQVLAIQSFAQRNIAGQIIKQPAQVAKRFCTDKKLKQWDYYISGERHARDAIRHGCYYILFGAVRKEDKNKGSVG